MELLSSSCISSLWCFKVSILGRRETRPCTHVPAKGAVPTDCLFLSLMSRESCLALACMLSTSVAVLSTLYLRVSSWRGGGGGGRWKVRGGRRDEVRGGLEGWEGRRMGGGREKKERMKICEVQSDGRGLEGGGHLTSSLNSMRPASASWYCCLCLATALSDPSTLFSISLLFTSS